MIKLRMIKQDEELFLRIRKDNHILIENKLGYMNLFLLFYQLLREKQDSLKLVGYLDNKLIMSKDFILLNLLDLEQILTMTQFKKGSVLFEYINEKILEKAFKMDNAFYSQLDMIMNDITGDLPIDYELEENNVKLIQAITQFTVKTNNYSDISSVMEKG